LAPFFAFRFQILHLDLLIEYFATHRIPIAFFDIGSPQKPKFGTGKAVGLYSPILE
jgi:hypothetical protein